MSGMKGYIVMNETLLLMAKTTSSLIGGVHCVDALTLMDWIYQAGLKVDAIITDLPYGTTACSWDTIIPFEPMWAGVKRILKPRGVFVTTASQPFTSALVMSNPKWFRYEWIWSKSNGGGFLNANRQPLKRHENILIFCEGSSNYNPQMLKGTPYRACSASAGETTRDQTVAGWVTTNEGWRYPKSILEFDNDTGLHPTQKPLLMLEYLIDTYTSKGDLVLDFCAGSGTTAAAARQLNRRFIVGDSSPEYCARAVVA